METMQMQSAMAQQQHHMHQMSFRPTGPGPTPLPAGHCLDLNGQQTRHLNSSPFPDFQLAELHQTLENLINIPTTPTALSGPSYHQNRLSTSAGNDMPFLSMDQSDLCRHQPHLLTNNGNNNLGHNSNKRLSVDLGCSLSDYSESWSTNSPRSNASSEESSESSSLQAQQIHVNTKGATNFSIYPANVKRQNIGRVSSAHQLTSIPNNMPQKLPPNMMQPGMAPTRQLQHQGQQQQQPMLTPPMGQFMGRPRLFDFGSAGHRPQLHHHTTRSTLMPNQPHLQQGQRMPSLVMHQPMQQHQPNFHFNNGPQPPATAIPTAGGGVESAHQSEKRSRFMRTAQILEQSGLMDVTLKTAQLMRENANLQREIDMLMVETRNIEQQFLATRNTNVYQHHQQHPPPPPQFLPEGHNIQQENMRMHYLVGPPSHQMNGQPAGALRGQAPMQPHLVLEY